MKYRYLDIRRNPVKQFAFSSQSAMEVRKYLSDLDFCVETPYLIKSTQKVLEILLFLQE
jgi:aspartyl-tRNA synthetase